MQTILRKSGEESFLKDAIRDLVVVVVGILGALWIEATWQDYQDRQTEQQILMSLRAEFASNRRDLDSRLKTWRYAQEQLTGAHELIGGPINDETKIEFRRQLNPYVAGELWFDPQHGQLISVINSGQLGLIESSELRALIAGWPDLIDDLEFEREMFASAMTTGFGATIRNFETAWPDSTFEADIEHLMTSLTFDNEIFGLVLTYRIMILEGQVIFDSTSRIIDMIDDELGTR